MKKPLFRTTPSAAAACPNRHIDAIHPVGRRCPGAGPRAARPYLLTGSRKAGPWPIAGGAGRFFRILPVGLALLTLVAGCSKQSGSLPAQGQANVMAVPVATGVAIQKDVPVELGAIGTARPYASVSVKARVDGQLSSVTFRQGDTVKQGERIFEIDPRTFQALVNQAKAVLARDEASLQNAIVDMQRTDELASTRAVTASVVDANRAKVAGLRATVQADQAALESATLQLSFCSITSPVDGRIGLLQVDAGNMVKNNDTVLAVVNQTRPIYVDFSVPEQFLPEVRGAAAARPLRVRASVPQHADAAVTGELEVINNEVDRATGTVLLRAVFPNEDERLWPGQFLDVTLELGEITNAVVVPSQALQNSQSGEFVFVVKPDRTVEKRLVKPGPIRNTETVIETGLAAGETVVTDGQMRLVPGATVKVSAPQTAPGNVEEDGGAK
ncbi:MAG: efflux RND transporter periplasmic adaptor subunit [Verrucomicrobia bacterium]|nr:efflux RND transporter periplasmic adaptor subunit [Verrucomicrobiota bacterium]